MILSIDATDARAGVGVVGARMTVSTDANDDLGVRGEKTLSADATEVGVVADLNARAGFLAGMMVSTDATDVTDARGVRGV